MQKNNELEKFKATIRKHSLKATRQRLAVHKAMLKLGHASADMVTKEITAAGETDVTVATVYNILTQLADLGIYEHRMSSNNKMYFDVNTFKHAHMYDCENHFYKDVMDEELMELVRQHLGKKKFRGYSIQDIEIQIIVKPTRRKRRLNS